VYRGLAADTTRKPSVDTMAYILLDTNTNIIWQYKKAVNNAWTRVGGSISSGVTGTLPVANGGTNTSTAFTAGSVVFAGASGTYTQDNANLFWNNTNKKLGIGTSSPAYALDVIENNQPSQENSFAMARFTGSDAVANDINLIGPNQSQVRLNFGRVGRGQDGEMGYNNSTRAFRVVSAGLEAATFDSLQRTGIGTNSPTERLDVNGNARIRAVGSGTYGNILNITSDGTLTTATSDEKYKYNILPITYGLNTILQLKPVNFQWVEGEENDLGFIAQDVAEIIPEAVNTNWNSNLLMRYESIIPILTKAIQEQQALIKALEQRILILENK
jgi:hypothetical protein